MMYFLIFSPVCYKNVKFVTRNIIADDKIFVKFRDLGRYLAMTARLAPFAKSRYHAFRHCVTTFAHEPALNS